MNPLLNINLHMDFSERVVIDSNDMDWLPSPLEGVTRKPLARENQESGHATSIVLIPFRVSI